MTNFMMAKKGFNFSYLYIVLTSVSLLATPALASVTSILSTAKTYAGLCEFLLKPRKDLAIPVTSFAPPSEFPLNHSQAWRQRGKSDRPLPMLEEVADSRLTDLSYDQFTYLKAYRGHFGGIRHLVRRNGYSFDPSKNLEENGDGDFVLNVRVFPQLFGEEIAHLMGFQIVDDSTVIIPDEAEIGGFFQQFNDSLPASDPRRIPLTVYLDDQVISNSATFNNGVRTKRAIPVSFKGKQRLHDLLVHALQGFALPHGLIERFVHYLNTWEYMKEEIRRERLSKNETQELNKLIKELNEDFSHRIDGLGEPLMMVVPYSLKASLRNGLQQEAFTLKKELDEGGQVMWDNGGLTTHFFTSRAGLLNWNRVDFWMLVLKNFPERQLKNKLYRLAMQYEKENPPPSILPNLQRDSADLDSMIRHNLSPEEWEAKLKSNPTYGVVIDRINHARRLFRAMFQPNN